MRKIEVITVLLIFIVASVFIVLIPYAAIAGDHLHQHNCNADEILRFNGIEWECSTDYDTLYGLSCVSGQVAKWNGSEWVCADDEDTDTDTLSSLECDDGQVAKWNDTDSEWQCADDNETASSITTAEQLRIIRGNVDADGTILEGLGFTVDRLTGTDPTGQYIITFDAPFSDNPTPLITSAMLYRIPSVVSLGTGGFIVIFYQSTPATPKIDSSFYFMVVGPQ
jgi:hypothetical protein